KDIVPLKLLNRLFRGPRILFGYYQGGLIVDYLAREHGFDKVVKFLRGYGEDRSVVSLFRRVFVISRRVFYRRFLAHLKKTRIYNLRFEPQLNDRTLGRMQADASDHEALLLVGWAYAQRQNPIDASRYLQKVLRDDPENGRAKLLHAELLRQRGATEDAAAAYREGFAAGASDFDSHVRFGQLLEGADDAAGAIEQYQRAKDCWPGCTDQKVAPSLLLARLYRELGRQDDAMVELRAFCELTGRAFQPRLELAEIERKRGDRRAEARYLREAAEIDPFLRRLHVRLGDALVALEQLPAAIKEYEVALAVPADLDRDNVLSDPSAPPIGEADSAEAGGAAICVKLARIYLQMEESGKAQAWLSRAIEMAPDSDAAEQARSLRRE
ncbi:MAG: tetratricopeptide repeat protein, partial [Planctomycetota bacterium]|nr:tetratricopeptide repeat protein [Planctomycetota bacterium]